MADKIFIGTGAAIDLSTAGNYSPSGVPANGDRLFFINSTAGDKITAGLTAMSAVTLAALYVYDTYTAQMGTDALSGGNIEVGYNVMHFGFPSGVRPAGSGGGPSKAKINAGSVAGVNIVYTTGTPTDQASGGEALRWRGTHASGNQFTVLGGTVGIATQDLASAVVNDINVQGGTLNVGINSTPRNMDVSGGTFRHGGLTHASGYIKQLGGTLYTYGTTLIPTITVGGKAFLNHRVSGTASVTTMLILGTGECDLRQDPRNFAVTNPTRIQKGGRLYLASAGQLDASEIITDDCTLDQVTIKTGTAAQFTPTPA